MNPNEKPITCTGRTEFIGDINITGLNQDVMLSTNGGSLPNDRFLLALYLTFEGRFTNPAANFPTGQWADAPFSFIENVRVEGQHRLRPGRERFIEMRGADLREYCRDFNQSVPFYNIGGTNPYSTTNLSYAANATNDVRFTIPVPFTPLGVGLRQQIPYLLDCPNYDQLQLTIRVADMLSVFSGQTTQPTVTAYGSAAGNARIRVHGVFAMSPNKFAGFVPARLWRFMQELTSGDIVSGANNSRLFNVAKGNRISRLGLKTGTRATVVTGGNNVYATLTQTPLSEIKLLQGINRPIRYWADQYIMTQDHGGSYGPVYPTPGFQYIDFVKNGNMGEVLDTKGLIAGSTGDTDLFVQANIAAGANQACLMFTEELRGQPINVR